MSQAGNNRAIAPVEMAYAIAEDFAEWLPLWQGYLEFYETELADDVTRRSWERFLNPEKDQYCLVAKIDQKIVGFATFTFHASTWTDQEYCYLEDLFVNSELRGQKIGKQLIEFVAGIAKARNCARVYWHTHETNHTAQKLYDWIADKPGMVKYQMSL